MWSLHTVRPARRTGSVVADAAALLVAAAVLFGGVRADAQPRSAESSGTFGLRGNVRAADESRLVGAHVDLLGPSGRAGDVTTTVTTDAGGAFRFDRVAVGSARLVVRRLGFRPETLSVEVPQLDGGPIAVLLERVAQPLAPVVVREARRPRALASAFDRRRTAGFGRFITRREIEQQNPQRTTDLLRRLPGVSFNGDEGGASAGMRGVGSVAGCAPVYFVDGSPLGSGALDLDAIPPSSIEAIEIYNGAATVPAALRSAMAPGGCGAIAIWSRRGDFDRQRRGHAVTRTLDSLDAVVAHGGAFTADQVELAAAPLPGFSPAPVYPDSLRDANVLGRVVAEFVVDERGRVAPETVGIVSSSHPLFGEAVRDAIAESRFSPAYRQGRVVRQVVHLPVVFEPGVGSSASSTVPDRRPY